MKKRTTMCKMREGQETKKRQKELKEGKKRRPAFYCLRNYLKPKKVCIISVLQTRNNEAHIRSESGWTWDKLEEYAPFK